MLSAYTGTAIRAAEQPLLDAGQGPELMARAAYGLANGIVRSLGGVYGRRVCLLVGKGNNGGDALYAGAQLLHRGAVVTAVLCAEGAHTEGLAAFQRAGGRVLWLSEGLQVAIRAALNADTVVDAILGTGARGGLRGAVAELITRLESEPELPPVVACDLSSGVNADDGTVLGPVLIADETVTFGGLKAGLLLPPGEEYAGQVSTVDIGLELGEDSIAVRRLVPTDMAKFWPQPVATDHKYTRGVLGVVAGSHQYPGAAELTVQGAQAAGVGMIRYLGPAAVAARIPVEVVPSVGEVAANHVQAWVVGPGVAEDSQQEYRCFAALTSGLPVVADAGALALLPDRLHERVVLTPHAGELAALLARRNERNTEGVPLRRRDVEVEPLRYARRAAELTGATVLLKGATTVVATAAGEVYSQAEGSPWLATAGSGDVLAGILGALLASGVNPGIAAAMAASVHGTAGAEAAMGGPIIARQIAQEIPNIVRELLRPTSSL